MMKMTTAAIATTTCLVLATAAFAQEGQKNADGSYTWQAGVDGVKIDFAKDGHAKKIYSKYTQPVTFADKRGIKTATIIAEEKAKDNIVRFIQQDIMSKRIVTEIEGTFEKTAKEKTGSTETLSESDQRNIVNNLTQITGSSAQGVLRGVIVLEQGYDPKEQEVWVVAGVSDKTTAAAKAATEMMAPPVEGPTTTGGGSGAADSAPLAPRQVKRNDSDF